MYPIPRMGILGGTAFADLYYFKILVSIFVTTTIFPSFFVFD